MKILRLKAYVLFLAAAVLLASCMVQTDNSVNGDASTYAPLPPGTSKAFARASVILKNNCAQCHADDWCSLTEQQLVEQGYIVAGNPDMSKLYGHLKGSNNKGGFQEDMPQNLPPLSRQNIRTIRDWIEQVPTGASPTPIPTPSFSDTPFGRAQAIIVTNCASCHHHKTWTQFEESDFIAKQLVIPGDANASVLYQNLQGADVPGVAAGEMPEDAAPLPADELQAIAAWIDQIPVPSPSPSPSVLVSPTPTPSAS